MGLKDHFKDCGRVVRADVNRGYGTVEFEKAADAAAAISRKSNTELDGRKINVREDREASKPSQARKRAKSNEGGVTRVGKRVYVGNLKFTTSWQTLKDHFKPVGDVVHAKLIARGCGIRVAGGRAARDPGAERQRVGRETAPGALGPRGPRFEMSNLLLGPLHGVLGSN